MEMSTWWEVKRSTKKRDVIKGERVSAILNSRRCTGWLKIKYPTGEYAISLQPVV